MKRNPVTVFRNPLARLCPIPASVRNRLVLRAYTALDSLTSGAESDDVEAWRDLADVVNITETLATHLRQLDLKATVYTQAAIVAMRAAQDRHKRGMAMRLDGQGIEAVRAVLSIYEQVLALLPERQVEDAMKRTADEVRKLIKNGAEVVSL